MWGPNSLGAGHAAELQRFGVFACQAVTGRASNQL